MHDRNLGGKLPDGTPKRSPPGEKIIPVSVGMPQKLIDKIDGFPAIKTKKISRSQFICAVLLHRLELGGGDVTESDIDAIVGKLYG
ncbi:MAG: hypothetical protein ACRC62_05385 [Microcoleus sp.]